MQVDLKQIGHSQAQILKRAFEKRQLAQSYLFVDQDEQEALNTAYWLACLFNCTGKKRPDGRCRNCRQILSGNHPDVLLVQAEGQASLKIDQIRPLKEELAKSPVESPRRFFFIANAEKLTLSAANALLNLLEEPVAPVVSILITNNADQILPTIRSRTQIVNFASTRSADDRQDWLITNGFSKEDVNSLGKTTKVDQMVRYFYQECLEKNALSLITAHQLANQVHDLVLQKYVFLYLKRLAEADLKKVSQRERATHMLEYLIDTDKMSFSNIGFRNLLDYLALQWR